MNTIRKVAVLGAGTMGARIAAHMANAGVPCYLLDIVPPGATGADRNKIAAGGLQAALSPSIVTARANVVTDPVRIAALAEAARVATVTVAVDSLAAGQRISAAAERALSWMAAALWHHPYSARPWASLRI